MSWERHQQQGREEAAAGDSPRVLALVDVAKSLHYWGFTEEEAVDRLVLIVNTSSRVEREYITGVVAFIYETA